MDKIEPRTDKARGILACQKLEYNFGVQSIKGSVYVIPYKECPPLVAVRFPMFGRPCPLTPRHGFVDSKPVLNWTEVIYMLAKSAKEDLSGVGEIVLQPILRGKFSAVVTNNGITWGAGNDGVTAGSAKKLIHIPVSSSRENWVYFLKVLFLTLSREDIQKLCPDIPYLELVENNTETVVVQIRNGPEQGINEVDFIPVTVEVNRVLKVSPATNLLNLDKSLRNAPPGLVVNGVGMPLSAHACVQAMCHNIPVITSRAVHVHDVLTPTKHRRPVLKSADTKAIAKTIRKHLKSPWPMNTENERNNAVLTSVGMVQVQWCWDNKPYLLEIRAVCAVMLLRAVLAGCMGEMRYASSRLGPWHELKCRTSAKTIDLELAGDLEKRTRCQIQEDRFASVETATTIRKALAFTSRGFGEPGWGNSYGGRKWDSVAKGGILCAIALGRFLRTPSPINWNLLIAALNAMINVEHNNGKCLTKYVTNTALLMVTKSPASAFLNPFIPLHWAKKGSSR